MNKTTIADEKTDRRRGIDHIGVGVCMVVHDGQGNFLMMQRGPQARDEQGKWDICGGAIEFGELVENAVKREIMEEICVEPTNVEFITAYEAHREHEGSPTHWVQLLHTAQVDPTAVKIGEPHKISQIGWFNSTNLPEPRHSMFNKSYDVVKELGIIK